MGGKQGEFSVDDYVPAALSLYLDIIVSFFCCSVSFFFRRHLFTNAPPLPRKQQQQQNLFMALLRIIGIAQRM